jgi:class 3 adenylate cyclase
MTPREPVTLSTTSARGFLTRLADLACRRRGAGAARVGRLAARRDRARRSWLLGRQVRAGVHTGEVEARGDAVSGIAVNIGARIGAKATASEVLVSQTVKDLVAGSGLTFEDRGLHKVRGVPEEWRPFAVAG